MPEGNAAVHHETLDGLRASRERLVLAADGDRRRIERELHDGIQQQLIAIAVNLQRALQLVGSDAAARSLLDEIARDVQDAHEEAARLAEWLYPPLLEAGGLGPALRAVAARAGVLASVDVHVGGDCPAGVAETIYFSWLRALEHAPVGAHASVSVREDADAIVVEAAEEHGRPDADCERLLRDRVEALGGRVTIETGPDGGIRVSGSLPLSRARPGTGSRP